MPVADGAGLADGQGSPVLLLGGGMLALAGEGGGEALQVAGQQRMVGAQQQDSDVQAVERRVS